MQRRRWLQVGIGAATVLAAGGSILGTVHPGLFQGRLAPAGRQVMRAAGEAVLDACLPSASERAPALDALLARLDQLITELPPHAKEELHQLLTVLASTPGRLALAGLASPWAQAGVPAVQKALQDMRTARLSLSRQAYQALHDLSAAAWFSDQTTWPLLGYPGPRAI